MTDVLILGGARTPMTKYVGALKDVSAIKLGAIASRGAFQKTASSLSGSIMSSSAMSCRQAPMPSTAHGMSG